VAGTAGKAPGGEVAEPAARIGMRLPRGWTRATFARASSHGDTVAVGSILMPSISKVGGPHAVGMSLYKARL
jgi:hypothetical protein